MIEEPVADPGQSRGETETEPAGNTAGQSDEEPDPPPSAPVVGIRGSAAFILADDAENAPFFMILPSQVPPSPAQLKLYAKIAALLEPLNPRPDAPSVVRAYLRQLRAIADDGLMGDESAAERALAEVDKVAAAAREGVLRSAEAGAFVVKKAEGKFDMVVTTRHGFLAPEDQIELLVKIQRLVTVLQVMFRMRPAPWWERLGRKLTQKPEKEPSVDPRAQEYMDQLIGIAGIGLESDPAQVKLASEQLAAFQEQLVSREATYVKNGYMRRFLGYVLVAAVFLALWPVIGIWLAEGLAEQGSAWVAAINDHRNFAVLLIGATVGAWLSFGMRKVIIGFSDLAALEEDRLDPPVRILFVCGLSLILGLLFITDAVTLQIGGFDTDFKDSVAKALLIGLFCGVSEQALSTAVGRRAGEFMGGVSGAAGGVKSG